MGIQTFVKNGHVFSKEEEVSAVLQSPSISAVKKRRVHRGSRRYFVLRYAMNTCYIQAVSIQEAGVTISRDGQRWWMKGDSTEYPVGYARNGTLRSDHAVIGVYEQDNLQHINNAIHNTVDRATDPYCHSIDID